MRERELFDASVVCQRCGGGGTIKHGTAFCPLCKGDGVTTEKRPWPVESCESCNGTGYVVEILELPDERIEYRTDPCADC